MKLEKAENLLEITLGK